MNILYITYAINGLLMVAVPIILAWLLTRRFHTGWRLVWIGAITFILSQVGHIPFNMALDALFDRGVIPAPPEQYSLIFSAVILGLSAGIWEESARYIAYRWPAKDARWWGKGLVLGSGHGGVEAFIVGLLFLYTFIQMIALQNADLSTLVPEEQLSLVQAQIAAFWSAPWPLTILGGIERVSALCFHLAASVIVLQCFIRKQIRWLIFAILWHTIFNAVSIYAAGTWGAYVAEALIAIMALISIAIIFALREPDPLPETSVDEELPPVLNADSLEILPEEDESLENLEKSRYN